MLSLSLEDCLDQLTAEAKNAITDCLGQEFPSGIFDDAEDAPQASLETLITALMSVGRTLVLLTVHEDKSGRRIQADAYGALCDDAVVAIWTPVEDDEEPGAEQGYLRLPKCGTEDDFTLYKEANTELKENLEVRAQLQAHNHPTHSDTHDTPTSPTRRTFPDRIDGNSQNRLKHSKITTQTGPQTHTRKIYTCPCTTRSWSARPNYARHRPSFHKVRLSLYVMRLAPPAILCTPPARYKVYTRWPVCAELVLLATHTVRAVYPLCPACTYAVCAVGATHSAYLGCMKHMEWAARTGYDTPSGYAGCDTHTAYYVRPVSTVGEVTVVGTVYEVCGVFPGRAVHTMCEVCAASSVYEVCVVHAVGTEGVLGVGYTANVGCSVCTICTVCIAYVERAENFVCTGSTRDTVGAVGAVSCVCAVCATCGMRDVRTVHVVCLVSLCVPYVLCVLAAQATSRGPCTQCTLNPVCTLDALCATCKGCEARDVCTGCTTSSGQETGTPSPPVMTGVVAPKAGRRTTRSAGTFIIMNKTILEPTEGESPTRTRQFYCAKGY